MKGVFIIYTIKGTVAGTSFTVTWDNGVLIGSPRFIEWLRKESSSLEGVTIGPVGTYTSCDHLNDPLGALFVMLAVFDYGSTEVIEGAAPVASKLPRGAIG